jgi:hypothetical protein
MGGIGPDQKLDGNGAVRMAGVGHLVPGGDEASEQRVEDELGAAVGRRRDGDRGRTNHSNTHGDN